MGDLRHRFRRFSGAAALSAAVLLVVALAGAASANRTNGALPRVTLLSVSYDATRELYQDIDEAFARRWSEAGKGEVVVRQSHGGSGKQARSVIEGLHADVVSLALSYDVDAIVSRSGLIDTDWQNRLPHKAVPFSSTIVLVVRKGNPKNIRDFDDLLRDDVSVITPNPKTSGGARWNYLAALGYFREKHGGDEERALEDVATLYRRVPVLDAGARGSTTTFVRRGMGDVLLSWENEARYVVSQLRDEGFEVITPSISIRAETPVSIVDRNVDRHGTREVSEAYVDFLFSEEGQEIGAKHNLRPRDPAVAARHASKFPTLKLLSIDDDFGGWNAAQKKHFSDGGTFDRIHVRDRSGRVELGAR